MATSSITKLRRDGIKLIPSGKRAGARLGMRKPEDPNRDQLPDGGYNYTHRKRFKTASQLLSRWDDVKRLRGNMNSFLNILRAYERFPYKSRDGSIKPSFGQLRFRVDQAITVYIDMT